MSKRILVVDNNPFFLEVIKKSLEPEGYNIATFTDPMKALEAVKKEHFDYIFVDHIMPKIDGMRLCSYLKNLPNSKHTPVIILTGVAIEASAKVKEINADAYIAKSPVPNFISDLLYVLKQYDSGSDTANLKEKVIGVDKIYPREMTKEFIEIESHLSKILSSMAEGVIECDHEYKIFFANQSAINFLKKNENEIIGENLFKVLGVNGKKSEIKPLFPTTKYIQENDDFSFNFCIPLEERFYTIHINALKTSAIEHGVLIVLEDVTELSQKISALSAVNNFAKVLASEIELEDVVKKILNELCEFVKPDTAALMLFKENEPNNLILKDVIGLNKKLTPGSTYTSAFLASRCSIEDNALLIINDPTEIEQSLGFIVDGIGYKPSSAIVHTIKFQHRCLGTVVFLKMKNGFKEFSTELFQSLVSFGSIALENAMRYRKLKELNIWRQNYMANISHELRTPLTIVKGFNEILCEDMVKDEEGKKNLLKNMLNEVNKLARLIDNLLTISKFENLPPFLKIKRSRLELNNLVKECIEEIKPEAKAKNLSFVTNFYENAIFTEGDPELLTQSIYHLLSNAIKYSYSNGRIEVSTILSGSVAHLIIKDYGAGIPEEHLNQIYEKFYMIDAGPDKVTRGAGIGLYLVREIVNLHYGNIQVDSVKGQGTRFTIKLPAEFSNLPV
ncbi:MAG: hypothetical protein OHK0040_01030 [bacterium]